ncbi:penicillin acylase family protein [Alteromonas flava]|uniref:penicillin acylase family protein n=1 Tax=Alteromonas flava TaxID=2048003 RepID=UPI000C285A7A|nr:penicillin acylase family protein [Alteromonas flava]
MKRILLAVVLCLFAAVGLIYITLFLSLPDLDSDINAAVSAKVNIQRDAKGHTLVTAQNRVDAAYATGFAHAQDRLFQMDLLRRSGAGEIAELFGDAAVGVDTRARFHQFRQRAQQALKLLSENERAVLDAYANGVNNAVNQYSVLPFEYLLLGADFKPWLAEDSLLVSYSMYIDLQNGQVQRDLVLTQIAKHYGQPMLDFILLPSNYQAALDYSEVTLPVPLDIPAIKKPANAEIASITIPEPIDIGSNNWAVSGSLTQSGTPMVSDDMHLGLRVPPIWYRLSLRYSQNNEAVELHGVSLPGTPGIIVGSNTHVAWGFTNANLDNTDWVRLDPATTVDTHAEEIRTPDAEHSVELAISEFGPVRKVDGINYALRWVAHQPYAVNLKHLDLDTAKTLTAARDIATQMGIPVQNMVAADRAGSIGWMPAGAVTARPTPSNQAIAQQDVSPLWTTRELQLPAVINPDNQRLWTANARVIGTEELSRFGDGGYALGARGMQIRDRLFEQEVYDEAAFYQIQQDNAAVFLSSWQAFLVNTLQQSPNEFAEDIALLDAWQACACSDSVGYTLTRKFRSAVINALFAPLESYLNEHELSLSPVFRHLEPATNAILKQQPADWLPAPYSDYLPFLLDTYRNMRQELLAQYADGDTGAVAELTWGKVNALRVQHPFSRVMPFLAPILDMPTVAGFGDSFLPAVQNGTHGASQRLTVQPGREQHAILTIPGGQSGHPLSPFYRHGFSDYINAEATPLLPGAPEHSLTLIP